MFVSVLWLVEFSGSDGTVRGLYKVRGSLVCEPFPLPWCPLLAWDDDSVGVQNSLRVSLSLGVGSPWKRKRRRPWLSQLVLATSLVSHLTRIDCCNSKGKQCRTCKDCFNYEELKTQPKPEEVKRAFWGHRAHPQAGLTNGQYGLGLRRSPSLNYTCSGSAHCPFPNRGYNRFSPVGTHLALHGVTCLPQPETLWAGRCFAGWPHHHTGGERGFFQRKIRKYRPWAAQHKCPLLTAGSGCPSFLIHSFIIQHVYCTSSVCLAEWSWGHVEPHCPGGDGGCLGRGDGDVVLLSTAHRSQPQELLVVSAEKEDTFCDKINT